MQFSMVMIICFAAGMCQTIFDTDKFTSYNECVNAANATAKYMMEAYPNSKGEIRCLDEIEIAVLKEDLKGQYEVDLISDDMLGSRLPNNV